MGCDIHTYREKFVDGQWQSADKWTSFDYGEDDRGVNVDFHDRAYTGRNYDLFGLLAQGVRREFAFGLPARGIPFDACEPVAQEAAKWEGDGHNHSYLFLHELKALRKWVDSQAMPIEGMMDGTQLQRLRAEMAKPEPTFNNLYPYCGWTSDPSYERFEIEMPMAIIVGDCLDLLIKSFEGVEGDNHRLVFFFDN